MTFEIAKFQIFEKSGILVRRTTWSLEDRGECFAPLNLHFLGAAVRKNALKSCLQVPETCQNPGRASDQKAPENEEIFMSSATFICHLSI